MQENNYLLSILHLFRNFLSRTQLIPNSKKIATFLGFSILQYVLRFWQFFVKRLQQLGPLTPGFHAVKINENWYRKLSSLQLHRKIHVKINIDYLVEHFSNVLQFLPSQILGFQQLYILKCKSYFQSTNSEITLIDCIFH